MAQRSVQPLKWVFSAIENETGTVDGAAGNADAAALADADTRAHAAPRRKHIPNTAGATHVAAHGAAYNGSRPVDVGVMQAG
jgi:hypothetical protein